MYQALADGWVPPTSLSEEEYRELKVAEPSALRGFAGFGCSFGGKWFDEFARGGGRDHANESYKALVRQAPTLRGRQFMHQSYDQFPPGPGDVVYLDPLIWAQPVTKAPHVLTMTYFGTPPGVGGTEAHVFMSQSSTPRKVSSAFGKKNAKPGRPCARAALPRYACEQSDSIGSACPPAVSANHRHHQTRQRRRPH